MLYHVIVGSAVESGDVTDGMTAEAGNGDTLTFSVTDGVVMVGDATVTTADVAASNGIIHVIDKVIFPPADEPSGEAPKLVNLQPKIRLTLVMLPSASMTQDMHTTENQ